MSLVRIVLFCLVPLVALSATLGYRWHQYVTNTSSPYDEVGMALNGAVPSFLNEWGCGRLHETFGNVLPPLNCEANDGSAWR